MISIPGPYTITTDPNGQWIVKAEWHGRDTTVFTPDNGDMWLDLQDTLLFVKRDGSMPANVTQEAWR